MRTELSSAGETLFGLLTSSTFYVVDCEYTATGDSAHTVSIISIAIVPVVQGRRAPASDELYYEMNPGVPISKASTKIHGFTDEKVAKLRRFDFYAPKILAKLADKNAVFVAHTSADIHALRAELTRLDERKAAGEAVSVGLSDLPNLPIIDTSTLARTLRYPEVGSSTFTGLRELCKLTGVVNENPHNARGDARATADALIQLLAYAAQASARSDLGEILREHRGGSTHDPRKTIVFQEKESDPELPQEHLDKHHSQLDHKASLVELTDWTNLANECALLRCQWLVKDAVFAGEHNAAALTDRLVGLIGTLTEPGQVSTLLGAVQELIEPRARAGGLGVLTNRATSWWRKVKPLVANAVPCGENNLERCPSCRQGAACPRDVLYQYVAKTAIYNDGKPLSNQQIKDLFKNSHASKIYLWKEHFPEIAAHAAWYVTDKESREKSSSLALTSLSAAYEMGIHTADPRLTLLTAEMLKVEERADEALELCREVLASRTSDLAFDDLDQWVQLTQLSVDQRERLAVKPIPTHHRLARPAGRINPNPYSVL